MQNYKLLYCNYLEELYLIPKFCLLPVCIDIHSTNHNDDK